MLVLVREWPDSSQRHWRTTGRQPCARGFTLLEVLIATVLSATLLATLWGLFGIYLRLFTTSEAQATVSHLVPALLQQFSDDLHSAIEDTPTEATSDELPGELLDELLDEWDTLTEENSPVRRFSLLGTRNTLQIDVLQVIPAEETPALNADTAGSGQGAATLQVPELRTIFYTFIEPRVDDKAESSAEVIQQQPAETVQQRPGLTRYELDFETPYGDQYDPSLGESAAWVPEVAGLELRYFDGNAWSSQWDSLKRKSLPVAVEVKMKVRPSVETQWGVRRATASKETGPDDADVPPAAKPKATQSDTAELPVYRLVIDLPNSQLHGTVRGLKPAVSVRSTIRPKPLSVPRLRVGKTPRIGIPATRSQSDRWIRTQP